MAAAPVGRQVIVPSIERVMSEQLLALLNCGSGRGTVGLGLSDVSRGWDSRKQQHGGGCVQMKSAHVLNIF